MPFGPFHLLGISGQNRDEAHQANHGQWLFNNPIVAWSDLAARRGITVTRAIVLTLRNHINRLRP